MLAKMETSKLGDADVTKEYGAADQRLFSLFEKSEELGADRFSRC